MALGPKYTNSIVFAWALVPAGCSKSQISFASSLALSKFVKEKAYQAQDIRLCGSGFRVGLRGSAGGR